MSRIEPGSAETRAGCRLLALLSAAAIGCPQLLDDGFSEASAPGADPGFILTGSGGADGLSSNAARSDAGTAVGVDAEAPLASDGSLPNADVTDAGRATDPSGNLDASVPAPSCDDGIQNQDEERVDCGGSCPACSVSALTHHYSFLGTGTEVVDTVGGASGTLVNATLNGSGAASLSGTNAFINLPNGLISAWPSATIEVWLTWRGGASWQRVFDFGSSTSSEDVASYGQKYLAFTPRGNGDLMIVTHSLAGYGAETQLSGSSMLPSNRLVYVAVVADAAAAQLSLYVDGQLDASMSLAVNLTLINDVNDWLGQSQYVSDPHLNADLMELRIYSRALAAAEIQASFAAGPDAAIP